jgi:hypothetical protein
MWRARAVARVSVYCITNVGNAERRRTGFVRMADRQLRPPKSLCRATEPSPATSSVIWKIGLPLRSPCALVDVAPRARKFGLKRCGQQSFHPREALAKTYSGHPEKIGYPGLTDPAGLCARARTRNADLGSTISIAILSLVRYAARSTRSQSHRR